MAKTAKKTTRIKKETTRQRPETTSREAKIQMLVGAGLGNAAIWGALEKEYPQIIEDDQWRLEAAGKKIAYDKDERARISRALNSTRALAIKDDERVMGLVEACGGDQAEAKSLDEMDLKNRHRFSWGIGALDEIYGQTDFVHLSDHEDSKYKMEEISWFKRDDEGVKHKITEKKKVWVKGSWKMNDPMIPDGNGGYVITREKDGHLRSDLDLSKQIIEFGCPEGFMSIWGGEPGVGKTKLAADAGKSVNEVTEEAILYVNGEDNEENFRMKCGTPPNPHLFKVVTANLLPVQRVCDLAYQIKPRIIFIDSVQTLAEWDKGPRGQKACLMILRNLQADPRAGKPHIVLISQLNKAGDLKGARDLEHLADCVAQVTRDEERDGVFNFDVPRKNRGGKTPAGAKFKHLKLGVSALAKVESRVKPFSLSQPTTPAIAAGVSDPLPPAPATDDAEQDELAETETE